MSLDHLPAGLGVAGVGLWSAARQPVTHRTATPPKCGPQTRHPWPLIAVTKGPPSAERLVCARIQARRTRLAADGRRSRLTTVSTTLFEATPPAAVSSVSVMAVQPVGLLSSVVEGQRTGRQTDHTLCRAGAVRGQHPP